jgi:branched-subunit amino acid transport protein
MGYLTFLQIYFKKETEISQVFRPFTQYFVESSLAAIIASSLIGYDITSLAHLYLVDFLPFFSADPLKLCQVG